MNVGRSQIDGRMVSFLTDALALWRVHGTVAAGSDPVIAQISLRDGRQLCIERPDAASPFRWLLSGQLRIAGRRRPCTSLVGLLSALRDELEIDRSNTIRILGDSPSQ